MKTDILCISDLHGYLPENLPACDVLVIAGDVCPATNHTLPFQERWLRTVFARWLRDQQAGKVFAVWGNHDWIGQKAPGRVSRDIPWTVLTDSGTEYRGLKFYGTPWQPPFLDWAFNLPEAELAEKFAQIPSDVNVLISHGPPRTFCDRANGEHCGSLALLSRLTQMTAKPLVVCGHIHPAHGTCYTPLFSVANASLLDDYYHPAFRPIMATFEDTKLVDLREF